MKKLRVDVWSDVVCPWCYIGKRRLEAALEAFPHAHEVEVVWRPFELDPSAPRERPSEISYAQRLADKYGSSLREAQGMIARMTDVAQQDGLDFHFEKARPGNTFDAHRVLHLAGARGLQNQVKERFLYGYFTDGQPIGEPETLERLAIEAGLDATEAHSVLFSTLHGDAVRSDERKARELGISGVPFFLVAEKYGLSGAQPVEVLLSALARAWSEL